MKRLLICVAALTAGLCLVTCSSLPKKPITLNDGPELKGQWRGMRFGVGYSAETDLNILNDSFPLVGEFTFYKTASGTTIHRMNGELTDGKIHFARGGQYWVDLSLYKNGGKATLRGDYKWGTYGEGSILFEKQ